MASKTTLVFAIAVSALPLACTEQSGLPDAQDGPDRDTRPTMTADVSAQGRQDGQGNEGEGATRGAPNNEADRDLVPASSDESPAETAAGSPDGGADAEGDPGAPDLAYGPKADANLYLQDTEVGYIFFTLLAPKDTTKAHMFAKPEPRGSEGTASYYISLVLNRSGWRNGDYQGAIAGRVEFVLDDGRRYVGNAAALDVRATITNVADGEREQYLRGKLQMAVPPADGNSEPLVVRMNINSALE